MFFTKVVNNYPDHDFHAQHSHCLCDGLRRYFLLPVAAGLRRAPAASALRAVHGHAVCQHEYPGALPHFHHHEKGKGELPGGAAVGISVHGHGVFAAENDEPGAVRHRAVQCLLRMAAKPLVHAAVRQQMSAGKVDDLLRGHPHRREISGVRGAGGPFVPHRVPHPFLDHADRLWLRGRGGGADRQLSHCVKERRACHGGRLCEKEAAPAAGGISHGYGACGESGIHAAKRIVLENFINSSFTLDCNYDGISDCMDVVSFV